MNQPKMPAADILLIAENMIATRHTCHLDWCEGDTILSRAVFNALGYHANYYWLAQPIEFKFKDGMTLNDFNAQLLANRSRELANLELTLGQPHQ